MFKLKHNIFALLKYAPSQFVYYICSRYFDSWVLKLAQKKTSKWNKSGIVDFREAIHFAVFYKQNVIHFSIFHMNCDVCSWCKSSIGKSGQKSVAALN